MSEYTIFTATTATELEYGLWAISEMDWEFAQYQWAWPVSGDDIARWRAKKVDIETSRQ